MLLTAVQVKESLCYVSQSFLSELEHARIASKAGRGSTTSRALDNLGGALKKQFVLPDFHSVMKGFVKPDDQPADSTEQVGTMSFYPTLLSVFSDG